MTETKPQPHVIIFSTPTCSFCNMAKKYFREKGIRFMNVDVSRDMAAARDMLRRSGQQGVPVIALSISSARTKIFRINENESIC